MFRTYSKILFILTAIFLIFPNTVFSQSDILKKMVHDLRPIEGVFIKTSENQNLINKGVKDGVKKGDLWTLFSEGKPVIDPVTNKDLGRLPVAIAVCKVIRTEEFFSEVEVKCLTKTCKIKSGQNAIRFKGIDVTFMDVGGKTYALYESIRAELPSLNWKGYQKLEKPYNVSPRPYEVLIFTQNNRMTVWSGKEILLFDTIEPTAKPVSQSTSMAAPQVTMQGEDEPLKRKTPIALGMMAPGLATNIEIKDFRPVGSIDHLALNIGMFKSGTSDRSFFIYLNQKTVYARAIDSTETYSYHYDGFGEILNMILGEDRRIVLNIYVEREGMHSMILSFEDGNFRVLARDINYILAMLDTNGDGVNDSLYGQNFDEENFLGRSTYLLSLENGMVKRIKEIQKLPNFNLMGAFMADINGNGTPEIGFYNPGRKLVIYEGNKKIWESSSVLGGSIKDILYDDPQTNFDAPFQVPVWSQSAVIFSGKKHYLAVPANDPGLLRIVGGGPERGGLGILSSLGNTYSFRKIAAQFQGPIQSVFVFQDALYMAVVEGNLFTGHGKTHILSVPLNALTESMK